MLRVKVLIMTEFKGNYRGYNPVLFEEANFTEAETEILLNELENSTKKGKITTYIIIVILVLLGCFFSAYQINVLTKDGSASLFRILLVPIAMAMALGIKFASSFKKDHQAGYKMKKDWRKPVLYLRSFMDDLEPGIDKISPSIHMGQIAQERYSAEALIKAYFSYYTPIIGLCKPGEEVVRGVPNRVVISGEYDWKVVVNLLLRMSSAVVFMATKNISNSIEWELKEIAKHKSLDKILFYIPKDLSDDNVNHFIEKIKTLFQKNVILYPNSKDFFIAYNKTEDHFEQVTKPKKFVKTFMKDLMLT